MATSRLTIRNEPTFAELARSLVPVQFDFALTFLESLNATTRPDGVKPLRINLLYARELLDMFSFAYPNVTAANSGVIVLDIQAQRHADILLQVRDDLNEGYEQLGAFQDLAHSLVKYNETDVEEYRAVCLNWQERFLSHLFLRDYTIFLKSPSADKLFDRPKSKLSKLFWGYNGAHPSLQLSGTANMAKLAVSLIEEADDQLPAVLEMEEIYSEPLHSRFHIYRKLIRSLLAVLQACPSMMPEEELSGGVGLMSVLEHFKGSLTTAVRVMHQALINHQWSSRRMAAEQGQTNGAISTGPADLSTSCLPYSDFAKTLGKIFRDLGQVNNWIISYQFYLERGEAEDAEESRQKVLSMWSDVKSWMAQQDLTTQFKCTGKALVRHWHL